MAWYRRGSPGNSDYEPHYVDPELFSIRIFYGGELTSNSYVGGNIAWFDFCDKDQMSMPEINLMVSELGYNKDPHQVQPIKYWYKVSAANISDGLTLLQVDKDVSDMILVVPTVGREIDILLEHVNPCELLESQVQSNVDMYDTDDELMEVTLLELVSRIKKGKEVATNNHLAEDDRRNQKGIGVATDVSVLKWSSRENEAAYSESEDDDSQLSYVESEYGGDKNDDTDWLEKFVDKDVEWVGSMSKYTQDEGTSKDFDFEIGDIDVEEEERDENALHSASDSDDENKKNRFLEFNSSTDMKEVQFKVGMLFTDCKEFRKAVTQYCVQNGKEVSYARNEKYKLRVNCKREGCPWFLYAGRHEGDCLMLKKCGLEHTCGRIFDNKMVKSEWLATTYMSKIKSNPDWPIQSMKDQLQDDYNCGVSDMKLFRAKKRAFKLIEGSHMEQYARLWDYAEEIKRTNPESTVKIKSVLVDEQPKFERMYICLGACKKGFKAGCRPLIGLDGCHLKGPYGGQLLTAVGIDANNQCWVIAYAMVEVENKSSWVWFLEYLVKDLEIKNQYEYTFISDKQKGLINAFEMVVPNSHQRFCVRHLLSNFKLQFKGKALKDKLWECARAATVPEFGRKMDEMKKLSKEAYEWLAQKPPSQWSKSHFNTIPKCDMLLNNICESFNAQLIPARSKPILTSMEMIRTLLMKRIQIRRDGMRKYMGKIFPKPQKVLETNKILAGKWTTAWNGAERFQVSCKSEQYVVDLHEQTCSCRKWDLTGIPCEHVVASINYVGGSKMVEDYVHSKYSKETFLRSYENLINPLNGPLLWNQTGHRPIIPPTYYRPPGRPRKLRRKEQSELENTNKLPQSGGKSSCGICRQKGHNARTHHKHLAPRPKAMPKSKSTTSTSEPSFAPKNKKAVKQSQTAVASSSTPFTSGPSNSLKQRVVRKKADLVSPSGQSTSGTKKKTTGITGNKKSNGQNASASEGGPQGSEWSHL